MIVSVNSEGTQPYINMYPFSPKQPSYPSCHVTNGTFKLTNLTPNGLVNIYPWKKNFLIPGLPMSLMNWVTSGLMKQMRSEQSWNWLLTKCSKADRVMWSLSQLGGPSSETSDSLSRLYIYLKTIGTILYWLDTLRNSRSCLGPHHPNQPESWRWVSR